MSNYDRQLVRIEQLRRLIETRQYWELERNLIGLDREHLILEREFGYSLAVAWLHLRRSREGLRLTQELLRATSVEDDALSHRIELLHAHFLILQSRLAEARASATRCVASGTAASSAKFAASSNNCLGIVLCQQGEWEMAVTQLFRTLTTYREIGNPYGIAASSHNLGMAYRYMGRFEEAESFFSDAATYYATDGIAEEAIFTEAERALAILGLGDGRLAMKMARRALERCRRLDNNELLGEALRVLAMIHRDTGRQNEARRLFTEAYRCATRWHQISLKAEINLEYGRLELRKGREMSAMRRFQLARKYYETSGATGFGRILADVAERRP